MLRNYRTIAHLDTIYEIWTNVITNKVISIINILTKDNQCAYKTNKSTMGITYHIETDYLGGNNGYIT